MLKLKLIFLTVGLFLATYSPLLADEGSGTEILASVGETTLSATRFNMMIDMMPPQVQIMLRSNQEMKKELINRWVEINLLVQEALSEGLDKDPLATLKIEEMRNRILVEELVAKKVDTRSGIEQTQIASYYTDNKTEFVQGEQVEAQHILIRVDATASDEDKEQARKNIEMIREKLKKGESFARLAQQYSEDPGSGNKGGNLGFFSRGQMVKEFEDAAFATNPGETSGPVLTNFGWHLIHVVSKKEPEQLPLEKVSRQIEAKLKAERNEKALQNLVESLKKKYPVTIK
ncbi:MAG: peptidylprolyl isomerase [Pseudomonadota bacterium]